MKSSDSTSLCLYALKKTPHFMASQLEETAQFFKHQVLPSLDFQNQMNSHCCQFTFISFWVYQVPLSLL